MAAEAIYKKIRVPMIDITDLTVEETAAQILTAMQVRTVASGGADTHFQSEPGSPRSWQSQTEPGNEGRAILVA